MIQLSFVTEDGDKVQALLLALMATHALFTLEKDQYGYDVILFDDEAERHAFYRDTVAINDQPETQSPSPEFEAVRLALLKRIGEVISSMQATARGEIEG
jgi:hypothetical protein